VPGSRSALNRTIAYESAGGVAIRIPDVESALSLKGATFRIPGLNPEPPAFVLPRRPSRSPTTGERKR
jgi:hypothetical protein